MADSCLEPLFALMAEANASDLHWCEGDAPRLRGVKATPHASASTASSAP